MKCAPLQLVWVGRRWLSGPNLPQGCNDICGNAGKAQLCQVGGADFEMRSDFHVWYPLEFDADTGAILPMRHLDSFQLDLV
jgi:hypothetical protein